MNFTTSCVQTDNSVCYLRFKFMPKSTLLASSFILFSIIFTPVAFGQVGSSVQKVVPSPVPAPLNSGTSVADKLAGRPTPEPGNLQAVTPAPIPGLQLLLQEIKNLQEALDFKSAEKKCRDIVARDEGVAEAHYLLGVSLAKQKKYQDSIQAFQDAIRIKNDYAEAKQYLAISYLNMKEIKAALAIYEELKSTYPEFAKSIVLEAKKLRIIFIK